MECNTETYNFKTIHGDMVLTKDFKIQEATALWDLEFKIYNSTGVQIETWNTTNNKLERLDHQT